MNEMQQWWESLDAVSQMENLLKYDTIEKSYENCVPQVEAEDCQSCSRDMTDMGIEYTQDVKFVDGQWICEHCNRPC